VKDIPATVGGFAHGATRVGAAVANDLGQPGYVGVKPPPGTGTHRLFIAVTALSVETLELSEDASLAMLNIVMGPTGRHPAPVGGLIRGPRQMKGWELSSGNCRCHWDESYASCCYRF
jgi:hypothetical protein